MIKIKSTKIALKHDPVIKSDDYVNKREVLDSDDGGSDLENEEEVSHKEYDYLLSMPFWSLTYERV